MKRRRALAMIASVMGSSIIGSEILMSCSAIEQPSDDFSNDMVKLLNEIGETILPASHKSPGAKEANIGEFIKIFVSECYDREEKDVFNKGLIELEQECVNMFAKNFVDVNKNERSALLIKLDDEARIANKINGKPHYYNTIKELTIKGYFTSEIGSSKALRYNPIPGHYEGCIDYKRGDKAWGG